MSKFELSISPDYVPDWTVIDAIRELFQNVIDHNSKWSWEYDTLSETLEIHNGAKLNTSTLLFGVTDKKKDIKAIGQFGEGYKLALLVLTRLKYPVTIYNGPDQIWVPRIIKSKRYNSKLLVIDVTKINTGTPHLVFRIEKVSQATMTELETKNLHVRPFMTVAETKYGNILSGEQGNVFVNGLFVTHNDKFEYGYSIKPEYLTIGRDRNLIRDFDLSWITSQLWRESKQLPVIERLVNKQKADVEYLPNFLYGENDISEFMYANFVEAHGKKAIPVSTEEEAAAIRKSYVDLIPVIIPKRAKEIIYSYTTSTRAKAKIRTDNRTPHQIVKAFAESIRPQLDTLNTLKLTDLLEISKTWR